MALFTFSLPSREDLFNAFIGDYAAAQPTKNVAKGSDPYRLGRVVSGAIWVVASKLLYFVKQALPDLAEREWLERWGSIFQFPRNVAVGSSSGTTTVLLCTGTPGSAITVNSELTHADGTRYKVTTTGAVIGGGGSVSVALAAISTGLATNKRAGEVLTFVSPPSGVTSTATIQSPGLTGGLDIEDYEAYRVRLLAHIADPPEGGAIHDYEEWARSISGVASAYVWAHRRGMGTIDVAALGLGTGSARIPSSTVLSSVDEYIESKRPGGVRDFLVLTTTAQEQDVECTIGVDTTRFGWDWDDAGIGYSITADDSGLSQITVPTAPSSVIVDKRITVLGEEALVTARAGNVLTLSFEDDFDGNPVTWFSFTPTGQFIRASGDLVKPVKNAILELFNTLGPARSIYSQTSWIGDLKRSKLFAAITDVDGVDDATINTPSSNVVPVDAYGTSVPFLVPRYIKVWKQ
jgi:uncharacterized phage protein gp47/JayE